MKRVQDVLALARQASSATTARTLKGTANGDAMAFRIRSMFAFSSIQAPLKQQADVERVAVLELRPKRDNPDPESWGRLVTDLSGLIPIAIRTMPSGCCGGLSISCRSRCATLRCSRRRPRSASGRSGMGRCSLARGRCTARGEVTAEQARQWLDSFDWSDFVDEDEGRNNVIDALFGRVVRLNSGEHVLLGALVRRADHREVDGVNATSEVANAVLALYGLRVSGGRLYVCNKGVAARAELLKGTHFASPDTLRRAPRASGCRQQR